MPSWAREVRDYSFTDWIYGPTALTPEQEPDLYRSISLERRRMHGVGQGVSQPGCERIEGLLGQGESR